MPGSPTVEGMIAELAAVGWTRHSATVWRAPDGGLFRGPYGAWKALRAQPENNLNNSHETS